MADRSHLSPSKTTDRNGKLTTVYRKAAAGVSAPAARSMPAPALPASDPAADDAAREYAQRLEDIAFENGRWRKGGRGDAPNLSDEAMGAMANMMFDVAEAKDRGEAHRLAIAVTDAINEDRHAAIIAAHGLAPIMQVLAEASELPGDPEMVLALGNDGYGPEHIREGLVVVSALQDLDLLSYSECHVLLSSPRVAAHGWAHMHGVLDYSSDTEALREHAALIDARPERVAEMAPLIRAGVHTAGIHAVLDGDTAEPLAPGAL